MKGYSKYFWFIHFIGDILFINIAFIFMYFMKFDSIDFSDKYRFLIIIFNTSKPDGTMKKLTDVSKLNSLGWKHKIPLKKGVEKMYAWYLSE